MKQPNMEIFEPYLQIPRSLISQVLREMAEIIEYKGIGLRNKFMTQSLMVR